MSKQRLLTSRELAFYRLYVKERLGVAESSRRVWPEPANFHEPSAAHTPNAPHTSSPPRKPSSKSRRNLDDPRYRRMVALRALQAMVRGSGHTIPTLPHSSRKAAAIAMLEEANRLIAARDREALRKIAQRRWERAEERRKLGTVAMGAAAERLRLGILAMQTAIEAMQAAVGAQPLQPPSPCHRRNQQPHATFPARSR